MANKPSPSNKPQIPTPVSQIIAILGGTTFSQMTGAHGFQIVGQTGLRFRLPNYIAQKQINRATIRCTTEPGVYDLQFSRKVKVDGKSVEDVLLTSIGVAAGQLLKCISDATGLNTDPFNDLM